ncbi:MAG: NAD-dependent epimerase/dehydratase family protein [Gemmatimonadota bacterium]
MSRVLLTGGTGFLGSHVAELLVEAGYDVRATIRATSDTRWLDPLPIETVVADLEDPVGLAAALDGVAHVMHVGGVTVASDPAVYDRVNAAGTAALAAAAGRAGSERFVLISSLAARGPDGAEGPVSPYGRSKRAGEVRLAELAAAGAAPPALRVLRPGGIYGPRDLDMLALFRMGARGLLVLPRVEGRLQPVYVRDVAKAALRALETADPTETPPLPVVEDHVYQWSDVGEALGAALGRSTRVVRVPPAAFLAAGAAAEFAARLTGGTPAFDRRRARDLTRRTFTSEIESTRRALGWTPETSLREGMAATVEWYREHGWL